MIFINSAIKQIGQDCLIFNLKTQDFYHGTDLKKEEFNRLFYTLVGGEAGNLPPFKKRKQKIQKMIYFEIIKTILKYFHFILI